MSQHCFECRSNEGYVTVMLGWDEALQWFHMFIGHSIDDDEPLYSNLYERNPDLLELEYFQWVLDSFGIKDISLRPNTTGLYETLMLDCEMGR